MFNLLVKLTDDDKSFLANVKEAMAAYFGEDQRRIDHALQVCRYAEELLAYVDADPLVTLSAAYLHDIGIHAAERKHGSSAGKWQELEGPPIAAGLLKQLGAGDDLIEQVVMIVGNHHTAGGVDAPEFRVIWDADALVNFAESLANTPPEQVETILQGHMVTEAGYQCARKIFLHNSES